MTDQRDTSTAKPKTLSWESELNDEKGTWERTRCVYREAPPSDEADRYVLYASHACPWATRVKMLLDMLGLGDAIAVIDSDPVFGVIEEDTQQTGWVFSEEYPDPLYGKSTLKDVYLLGNPEHDTKSTTPMLWDTRERRVLHNESQEMAPILHDLFRARAAHPEVDLYPEDLRQAIDDLYADLYEPLLNGVYRAGFASKQEVHDEVVDVLFAKLDELEARLSSQRWVLGDRFTFADIILFPTLWRFDFVYNIHFKCSLRRVQDYPALSGYVREIYSWPVVKRSNSVELTREHYYTSHYVINPHRLIAKVDLSWMDRAHGRDHLQQRAPQWFMVQA